MIIKHHKAGRSFKGVCRYLLHDAKAQTTERVAWTHTLNLAHDDVPSAVHEMLWTFRSADLLKREAGVGTGGSKLEKPVLHFSLSWPHGEAPTKAHMIETVRAYMKHMGYSDRQAALVAHDDTRHAHVHVVMNSVSPVDGRAVRSSHDWRRAEAFGLRYEREQGQVHCEQRLKPREDRAATPTREAWQRMKKSEIAFDRGEIERLTKAPDYFARHDAKTMNGREWEALKAHQKQQRETFFVEGKQAFRDARNAVFREVREEFRGQWKAFYAAKRGGHDRTTLAEMKVALTAAQNRALDERREAACDALRKQRDEAYEVVKAQQRFDRGELERRQAQGLRTYAMMDVIYPARDPAPPQRREPAPAPATKKTPDKTPWTTRAVGTVETAKVENRFAWSGDAVLDPARHGDDSARRKPGMVRRDTQTSAQHTTTDGVGRTVKEAQPVPEVRRPEPVKKEEPPRPGKEITDAASEKARVEKAREMTDQKTENDQKREAAALRASWNQHRRWRGGRD